MINRFILLLIIFAITSDVCAGDSNGKVTHLMVHEGDVVMFAVGPHANKPSCSTVGDHWALSLSSEKGKAMYAMLLAAAAQGHSVGIKGDSTCSAWRDRENPRYMWINYK